MKQVPRIKAAYDWMTAKYNVDYAAAVERRNTAEIARLDNALDTLSRGTFVLLFGQLELAVTETFEAARDRRTQSPSWSRRRGWDLPSLGTKRIPFETKLGLVLDRRSPDFRSVITAYALRNHVAHGGTSEPVGALEPFITDLYAWQAAFEG